MQISNRFWKVKYNVELIIAFFGAIVLIPLFLILILFQQIFDPGPIFFMSERTGLFGKKFMLYKFRSMKVGSKVIKSEDNKLITLEKDERITKYGSFLRLGFDELPQLINIFKGDMCLIGPRPDIVEELTNYTDRERIRLAVLPGITGLTQVVNGRSLSNKNNYELDVRYVLFSNIWTDAKILLLTLPYSFGMKTIGCKYLNKYLIGIK